MARQWESARLHGTTYEEIIMLKARAEMDTKEDWTIGDIIDEAVHLTAEHVEKGLATFKKRHKD